MNIEQRMNKLEEAIYSLLNSTPTAPQAIATSTPQSPAIVDVPAPVAPAVPAKATAKEDSEWEIGLYLFGNIKVLLTEIYKTGSQDGTLYRGEIYPQQLRGNNAIRTSKISERFLDTLKESVANLYYKAPGKGQTWKIVKLGEPVTDDSSESTKATVVMAAPIAPPPPTAKEAKKPAKTDEQKAKERRNGAVAGVNAFVASHPLQYTHWGYRLRGTQVAYVWHTLGGKTQRIHLNYDGSIRKNSASNKDMVANVTPSNFAKWVANTELYHIAEFK